VNQVYLSLMTRALPMLGVVALAPLCASSLAAVYKCTDATGKVVIGDHPCASGPIAPTPAASVPKVLANPVDSTLAQEAARAASRARIRAAQTPECLALGDRIVSAANDTGAAATPDLGQVVAQYEKQCAGRAKAAIQAESSRQEAEQKRQEKLVPKEAACTEKRRSLDERRAKLDTPNAQDKLAWARLLEEVSRECR
jgi:hypothetical protein